MKKVTVMLAMWVLAATGVKGQSTIETADRGSTRANRYLAYYDADRRGYVTHNNGRTTFTPALPPYQERIHNHTRVRLSRRLELNLRPESSYPRYMKMYPVFGNRNDLVHTPIDYPGNP